MQLSEPINHHKSQCKNFNNCNRPDKWYRNAIGLCQKLRLDDLTSRSLNKSHGNLIANCQSTKSIVMPKKHASALLYAIESVVFAFCVLLRCVALAQFLKKMTQHKDFNFEQEKVWC